jgi:aminoglycoside phosphotransferase
MIVDPKVEWLVSSGSAPEWLPVSQGESGDRVFRRRDGLAYLKETSGDRIAALAEECARLAWLATTDIAGPRVLFWQDADDGARLFTTAVPGVPASDLPADRLLAAWPSIVEQICIAGRPRHAPSIEAWRSRSPAPRPSSRERP